MFRRSARVLSVVSLLLFVALLPLAVLSHFRGAIVGYVGHSQTFYIRSEYGRLFFNTHWSDAVEQPHGLMETWPHDPGWPSPARSRWWDYGGFGYAIGGTNGGNSVVQIAIPYWSLVLLSALPVALRIARRQRRKRVGFCAGCGYDVRASPDRCPECGLATGKETA